MDSGKNNTSPRAVWVAADGLNRTGTRILHAMAHQIGRRNGRPRVNEIRFHPQESLKPLDRLGVPLTGYIEIRQPDRRFGMKRIPAHQTLQRRGRSPPIAGGINRQCGIKQSGSFVRHVFGYPL